MSTNKFSESSEIPIDQSCLAELELKVGPESHNVKFQSNDISLTDNSEAVIAFSLLTCMRAGCNLVINRGVSRRLLEAIDTISDIYRSWEPSLHRIEIVSAEPVINEKSREDRIGLFFSGGVDSFYSLLKHQDEITDLIFIHGFDNILDEKKALRERFTKSLNEIGKCFSKRIIIIRTNLRSFMDPYFDWARLSHGAALAGIGHLLFPYFKKIYIASTSTYRNIIPRGSHPLLDPLWSTESLQFIHDGCEATRIDKVTLISKYDIALQNLLVCWRHYDGAYNCGRCEKCLRTMVNLHIAGAMDRCKAFDAEFDIKQISKLRFRKTQLLSFYENNLKALENRPKDKKLYRAVAKAIKQSKRYIERRKRMKEIEQKCKNLYNNLKGHL
jgi:hypothetical protein